MKKIEAYIRPEKLEDVKEILDRFHLNGLSLQQVMGCGNQKGWRGYVRGTEVDYNFLPKIKLEMVVPDERAEDVIESVAAIVRTGEFGDGKIFVSDILEAVRIRTGERGTAAIR